MLLRTEERHYRHFRLSRRKGTRCQIIFTQNRTISTLRSRLYRVQETGGWGFRADRHCLANKKTGFTLIPEVRYWAATAKLRPLKLLPETQSTHVQCKTTRGEASTLEEYKNTVKQAHLPFTFFWLWDTTGRSASEEVKVCHSVHLNIIKVHFVIRSSINLRGSVTYRSVRRHFHTKYIKILKMGIKHWWHL